MKRPAKNPTALHRALKALRTMPIEYIPDHDGDCANWALSQVGLGRPYDSAPGYTRFLTDLKEFGWVPVVAPRDGLKWWLSQAPTLVLLWGDPSHVVAVTDGVVRETEGNRLAGLQLHSYDAVLVYRKGGGPR